MTRWLNGGMSDLARWWPLRGAEDLRARLEAAYADPARGYHDTLHLAEVLQRLDELATEPHDRDAVLLAAWFHDSVYDGQPGAEERSAQWAEQALPAAGVPTGTVTEVARLVRMTEHHRPADGDPDGQVLSDADLGILAADEARYAAYVATVRREYAHVPDDLFAAGRAAILRDLLAKPTLFHTAYARTHWEAPARDNVTRELAGLDAVSRGS